MQDMSRIVQWLKSISSRILLSEFPHLKKQFWGKHLWARGYLAVSSGNIINELIQQYIQEQEGEPVTDDSRFEIDLHKTPRIIVEGCFVIFLGVRKSQSNGRYTRQIMGESNKRSPYLISHLPTLMELDCLN